MNSFDLLNTEDVFITTGFADLDDLIGGFRSSGLYAIGGAPGMGKTTLVLSMILEIAKSDIPVCLFSYEMNNMQIAKKLLSIETEISHERISKGSLKEHEEQKLSVSSHKMNQLPLFIETSSRLKVDEIGKISRKYKEEKGIQVIFIDDIQRVPIDSAAREYASNREQEISANVRELKRLARELNIPIVFISQLNRLNEGRAGDRKPILIDLRDSGSIENDSDLVMFLYRPEYYGLHTDENGNSNQGVAKILISKNRFGEINAASIEFKNSIPKFQNVTLEKVDDSSLVKEIRSKINYTDSTNFDDSPF